MKLNLPKWTCLFVTIATLIPASIFAQNTDTNAVTPPPLFSEGARMHEVMGETISKKAKSADDFTQAANEFSQAAQAAPAWPLPRYNLALAKDGAGDYYGAIADLKTYQQFKLSDDDARAAQDKIYAIQAEQQLKQSQDAKATQDKVAADAANAQAAADQAAAQAAKQKTDFIRSIQGNWLTSRVHFLSIGQNDDGSVEITYFYTQGIAVEKNYPISNVKITGSSLEFTDTFHDSSGYVYIENYKLSLDSNGHLVGTCDGINGADSNLEQKLHYDCRFDRQ